jgi:hypothetical protein
VGPVSPGQAPTVAVQTIRLRDRAGDVTRLSRTDGAGVRDSVDILGATYRYVPGQFVRVVVRLANLQPLMNRQGWHEQAVLVRFAGNSDTTVQQYRVLATPFRSRSTTGELTLGESGPTRCAGSSFRVDRARDRVTVTVPLRCLYLPGLRHFKLRVETTGYRAYEDADAEAVYSDSVTAPRKLR